MYIRLHICMYVCLDFSPQYTCIRDKCRHIDNTCIYYMYIIHMERMCIYIYIIYMFALISLHNIHI